MGMRGPKAATAAEQTAKGARPNRVKKAAQAASVAAHAVRLGPAPGNLDEAARERWEFIRVHFTHLREADSILVRNLVLAQADLEEGGTRADRTALRKEIAAYLANLGCLPWQRAKFAEDGGADATAEAMAAFDA